MTFVSQDGRQSRYRIDVVIGDEDAQAAASRSLGIVVGLHGW
jgi:hypothetical protein